METGAQKLNILVSILLPVCGKAPYISEAMITTAAGLAVAIPTYAFYNLLVTKVENIVNEMEMAATEIIYFLSHTEVKLNAMESEQEVSETEEDEV